MPGRAALVFGLLFCSLLKAQDLKYSRVFPTVSKNLPLLILNTQHQHFYVLRYNRKAHDLTIERRAKPSAEIINFTPLKLDSVNSDLYNYSSLDYLLYEHKNKLFFVFEKDLNNKKTIYFKAIDTSGRAGGFTEICSMQRESSWSDFNFELAGVYGGNLLIISTQKFFNQSTKKTVMLYSMELKRQLWTKTLPLENSATGYSKSFCMDQEGDLFYVMVKAQVLSYKRQYIKHMQVMVPITVYDSLHLFKLSFHNNHLQRKFLIGQLSALHSLILRCDSGELKLIAQAAGKQTDNTRNIVLFTYRCSSDFNGKSQSEITSLDPSIKKRLTYYDGTDFEQAADKEFEFLSQSIGGKYTYHLTERKEGDIYKELLLWKVQNSNGQVLNQYLIPRRILSSETWSRYDGIGKAGTNHSGLAYCLFMAEANANAGTDPNTIQYYQLKKKSSLSNCFLMLFTPQENGSLLKIKLHHNQDFDFIPIDYSSSQTEDVMFYFTNGKQEMFAILEP